MCVCGQPVAQKERDAPGARPTNTQRLIIDAARLRSLRSTEFAADLYATAQVYPALITCNATPMHNAVGDSPKNLSNPRVCMNKKNMGKQRSRRIDAHSL